MFLFVPLTYFILTRPFDKKFKLINYTIEKGVPIYSAGLRTFGTAQGILLQPYRDKPFSNRFLSEIVRRRFVYQDQLYGGRINLRESATRFQIFAAKFLWLGILICVIAMILFLIHNFILYPEFAKARMQY
jgi:hypothetical protein